MWSREASNNAPGSGSVMKLPEMSKALSKFVRHSLWRSLHSVSGKGGELSLLLSSFLSGISCLLLPAPSESL